MHHFMRSRRVTTCNGPSTKVQQRASERSSGNAGQDCTPPGLPSTSHSPPEDGWFWSSFRCSQQAQEIGRFPRPTAADFACKHDQSGPGASTHQKSPFFQASCTDQRDSVTLSCARPRSAVSTDREHQGPKGELHPPKRKPFCHNLESSTVQCWLWHTQIQVTDPDIGCDPCTCFPAHFGRGHLHREATSRQQTRPWTRCAMVARGVQRAATTTDENTRRERWAETAKQQQAEQVRLDASVKARWRSGQSSTGQWDRSETSGEPSQCRSAWASSWCHGKWRSTREAASCCQPVRHPPGSSNGGGGGRGTSNQSGPRWFEPHHARQIPTTTLCFHQGNWTHACH